jgi:hypothetical protein
MSVADEVIVEIRRVPKYYVYLYNQYLCITTNIVSANPVHGVVYLIQHCGNLLVTGGFLRVLRFPSPIKLIDTYINEISPRHEQDSHSQC